MVAVLPTENLSGDPAQEYLADGVTDEMILELGRVNPERLGVIGRQSAMAYKGTRKRAAEIGREVGVDYCSAARCGAIEIECGSRRS